MHSATSNLPPCTQIMNGDVHLIQEINIIIVFFISGLVLKTGQ
jgi:hypothetical protein